MKTRYKILFAVLVCFGVFSISMFNTQYFQPTQGEVANVTFAEDLKVEFQDKPLKLFQLQPPNKEELNRHRGLVAKYLPNAKQDPSIMFKMDARSGLVVFNRGMEKYNGEYRPNLPEPKEAADIAMNFLKESGMMPKDEEQLKLIHNGGLRAAYVEGGKRSVTVDKLRTLTYGRQIDGIPVTGEGSKIVINVGDNGEIVSGILKWKHIAGEGKTISPRELKSESRARAEIKELIAKEFKGKAEIKAVQQLYYNGNGRFIQPVFAFEAMIYTEGAKQPIPYYGMIPAMNQPAELVGIQRNLSKEAQEYIKQGSTKQLPKQSDNQD